MGKWGKPGSAKYRRVNRDYQRRYRAEYPEKHHEYIQNYLNKNRERVREQDLERREQSKQTIIEAKDKPCRDCRTCYPPYVMDFDHVRGTKIANIGSGRFHGSMRALLKEIAKCDVVCANCHRKREHRKRRFQ